ncbi:unnamed protein product [Cochlearia groenlandica]
MVSQNHLLIYCILLVAITMTVQARTARKLLEDNELSSSYINNSSMGSSQVSFPSSHRSLEAAHYKRSPPPPPPKETSEIEPQTGI